MKNNELDQHLSMMRDQMPAVWWAMYQGCLDKGFDKYQSMNLLQTWIISQGTGGCRPNNIEGPNSDKE